MSFGRRGLQLGNETGRPIPAQRRTPDLADPQQQCNADRVAAFLAEERRRAADAGYGRSDHHQAEAKNAWSHGNFTPSSTAQRKSMGLAYVLWWFAYPLSAHRFYLGDTRGAMQQCGGFLGSLLLLGIGIGIQFNALSALAGIAFVLCFLWIISDMFFIPGLCRKANARMDAQQHIFS
ncbi:MAG: TM2 domain-containing protein [Sphingomonadales bacterium]|nr:TM2 domain-containing protein [Sphingomonadales bacterium]